jgi:hypothetical protein
MSNASPQEEPSLDNSPEIDLLLAHKFSLLGMVAALKPPADLSLIELTYVSRLIETLNQIVVDLERLKENPEVRHYIRNIGKMQEKIGDYALVELYTALTKDSEGDTQEYFRCLLRCPRYLEQALKELLI